MIKEERKKKKLQSLKNEEELQEDFGLQMRSRMNGNSMSLKSETRKSVNFSLRSLFSLLSRRNILRSLKTRRNEMLIKLGKILHLQVNLSKSRFERRKLDFIKKTPQTPN